MPQEHKERARADGTGDVIVVGGGGSGLAAAIEAATLGRNVIVLENIEGSVARRFARSARSRPGRHRTRYDEGSTIIPTIIVRIGKFNAQAIGR